MPFRPINFETEADNTTHDSIVTLVDQVLAAKKADPAVDTRDLEYTIDAHIFRLYALTPEEIKLVEEAAKK